MCLAGSHFGKSEDCHQQCRHPRHGGIVGGRDHQPGMDRLGLGLPLSHPAQMSGYFGSAKKCSGDNLSNPSWSQPVCGERSISLCTFPPAAMMLLMLPFLCWGCSTAPGLDSVLLHTLSEDRAQSPSHPSCHLFAAVLVPGAGVSQVRLQFAQRFIHLMAHAVPAQDEMLIPTFRQWIQQTFAIAAHCVSLRSAGVALL